MSYKMKLPFRQIHLDFHTAPDIPDIGVNFDADKFARRMKDSNVNSVTMFAKCHHGVSYYPTQVGMNHPNLKIDLMGEMIKALHDYNMNAIVYMSVARDELIAQQHQEWLAVLPNGMFSGKKQFDNEKRWLEGIEHTSRAYNGQQRWRDICMNNGYVDYVLNQTEEIFRNYKPDGIFFDIIKQPAPGCICNNCVDSMLEKGLDPKSPEDRKTHSLEVERTFMERASKLVWNLAPEASIFYNSRIRVTKKSKPGIKPEMIFYSHIEIESLPSGGWGYSHFPFVARYVAPFEEDVLGMTSRFHKAWGDCGSSRYNAALEYDCLRMLSLGCKCSIGDQLNPDGALEEHTYNKIGAVYKMVAEREPWCTEAKLAADIGVLITDRPITDYASADHSNEGVITILHQLKQQFHIIDEESDFHNYKLLILADIVKVNQDLADKLSRYLDAGGKLLLSHQSGLKEAENRFALDIGLNYEGLLPFNPDYLNFEGDFIDQFDENMCYVMYEQGSRVKLETGAEVEAYVAKPYYNRDWLNYCGQAQTPVEEVTDNPGIINLDNIIYISHPVFASYSLHAHEVELEIVKASLKKLLTTPYLKTDLPLTVEATVTTQSNRKIVHLLNYVPQHLARGTDVVIDSQYFTGEIKIRSEKKPEKVYLAPSKEEIAWNWEQGYISCKLPVFRGHAMIVIE